MAAVKKRLGVFVTILWSVYLCSSALPIADSDTPCTDFSTSCKIYLMDDKGVYRWNCDEPFMSLICNKTCGCKSLKSDPMSDTPPSMETLIGNIVKPDSCTKTKADIIFALDSSISVKEWNFSASKFFVRSLIDYWPVDTGYFYVGLVDFSSEAIDVAMLGDQTSKLQQEVDNAKFFGLFTRTEKALQHIETNSFTHNDRLDAVNVVILITDGFSNYPADTYSAAENLKRTLVPHHMFVIGVGSDNTSYAELSSIASDPDSDYVILMDSYKSILKWNQVQKAATAICDAIQPRTTTVTTTTVSTTTDDGCPNSFSCQTGCLPVGLKCDGYIDCWDFSDEFDCKTTKAPICATPTAIVSGDLSVSRSKTGDLLVTYICLPGHSLKGDSQRRCSLDTGTWDKPSPKCEKKSTA